MNPTQKVAFAATGLNQFAGAAERHNHPRGTPRPRRIQVQFSPCPPFLSVVTAYPLRPSTWSMPLLVTLAPGVPGFRQPIVRAPVAGTHSASRAGLTGLDPGL